MSASSGESKIDTKLFVSTADAVANIAKDLENCFQEWAKILQGLRGVWQGETYDDFKAVVGAVQNSAADLLRSLGGYKGVVHELAGIYDKTEKYVAESSKTLKFDRAMR